MSAHPPSHGHAHQGKGEQMLERTGVVQSQGQEQFGEQRDGGQGLRGHGLVAAAQSVPL